MPNKTVPGVERARQAAPPWTARSAYLLIATGAVMCGIAAIAVGPPDALWTVRIALHLILAVCFVTAVSMGPRLGLMSPLLVLSAISLSFYSTGPALILWQADSTPAATNPALVAFSGSFGDRLFILFSALSLAAASLVFLAHGCLSQRALNRPPLKGRPLVRTTLVILAFSAAVGHAAGAETEVSHWLQDHLPGSLFRNLLDSLPPVLAASLSILFVDAILASSAKRLTVTSILILVCCAIPAAAGFGKLPSFIVFSCALLWLVMGKSRLHTKAAIFGAALLFAGASLGAMVYTRGGQLPDQPLRALPQIAEAVGNSLAERLGRRQYLTGYCFVRAVDIHSVSPQDGDPFYFLLALVPRAVWPDKPNLSPFQEYAVRYCPGYFAPDEAASISLLGEPVVRNGVVGLGVALAVLFAGLGTVTLLLSHGGWVGLATLTALMPWLIDFDQNFSLYWANALKMFLFMAPVLGSVAILTNANAGRPFRRSSLVIRTFASPPRAEYRRDDRRDLPTGTGP